MSTTMAHSFVAHRASVASSACTGSVASGDGVTIGSATTGKLTIHLLSSQVWSLNLSTSGFGLSSASWTRGFIPEHHNAKFGTLCYQLRALSPVGETA